MFPTLIFFVHILTIGRNLPKKAMCPKKVSSPTSLNPQIQAKLSFWPKVLHLPINLPTCARSINDVVPLRHEFACAVGMRRNN